jgi:8-amino-7-oxononanoate synthase
VLDFTSALYLGLEHSSSALPAWFRLTLGKPALEDPPGARHAELDLAALTGCEAAVIAPSTLHLFVDLIPMLTGPRTAIFVDCGAYRTAWWGIEQASASGAKYTRFGPRNPEELRELMNKSRAIPIVIADGLSVASGQPTPVAEYAREAARRGGVLVMDDTQALGIYSEHPEQVTPYGTGGGVSLPRRVKLAGCDFSELTRQGLRRSLGDARRQREDHRKIPAA